MTTLDCLKEALIEWRKVEREHGTAVLRAIHPSDIRALADTEARALNKVRIIVDSEPWADIAQGL